MTERSVIVVGAGIAGLTAALSLARASIPVLVVEQAPALREVGAGLQISANGTRVLFSLGLRERIMPLALEAQGKVVRMWNTGETRPLFDLGSVSTARYGFPYLMMHRADLHSALAAALEETAPGTIRLGCRVTAMDEIDGGVRLTLSDGDTLFGRAVIGADGVHSTLRKHIFNDDAPEYTGCMAWRGLARADKLPERLRSPVGTNWIGPGAHVIQYPVRRGELINFVGIVESQNWTEESWTQQGTREECAADFVGWHEDVLELIANLDDEPNKWGLMGRRPMETWSRGNVCLIGDACHPTLPFLAQGANMAIEDGYVMALCLQRQPSDIPAAFHAFERLRLDRTSRIVLGSAENAQRFHNPALADPEQALLYLNSQWQPDRVEERYDWLFAYKADEVVPA
jgi:salicylate hydroxylase